MSLVNFSNLDFSQIKKSIIDHLKSNSTFTDYDFEGSNLSVLIDTLAYNTYIASFNANMISNEVFIDSATLRENVVSLARNIGYVPRPKRSARAVVSFVVTFDELVTKPVTVTLKSGLVAVSQSNVGTRTATFVITNDVTVPVTGNTALFADVEILEGIVVEESHTYDPTIEDPRIILNNPNVDTTSLSVKVRNNSVSTGGNSFKLINNLFEAKGSANVFFIQEVQDQRYELIFGDNIFGKSLEPGNVVDVSYVMSNGATGNGVRGFSFAGNVTDNDGRVITSGISPLETIAPAIFGEEIESIDSIKKYSTKVYQAQNRAVTSADYEAIVPSIYPEAEIVSAYGGETLEPPEYGRVFIAIKPKYSQYMTDLDKRNLVTNIRSYAVTGVDVSIVDMKFLFIEIESQVYFDPAKISSAAALQSLVTDNLNSYSKSSEMNGIGTRFKYSRVSNLIDNTHRSVESNITNIQMRRDLVTTTNSVATYEICFGNPIRVLHEQTNYNIRSSGFTLDGIDGVVYLGDIPSDDGVTGKVVAFRLTGDNDSQVARQVGSIDYDKGEIMLFNIQIESTVKDLNGSPLIEISASPESNDIIGLQDLYLQLDVSNSDINAIVDRISSGSDLSGATYIRSSSYFDFAENLIRN
jgi:hypothetical protein|tara:strand:+ start:8687 stop:10603 length:1917 start_codon:yes stop_codon:yes gene_type:complete